MLKSIKTSEANRIVVRELTNKLALGPENLIARIAFAYSISSQDRKMDLSKSADSKGKEYGSDVLFGTHIPIYVAIICQKYDLYKTDPDIPRYIKMHIDDGLSLISEMVEENPNLPLFDFVIEQIDKGLVHL
ncbi:DndE family protein [Chloroflexota bacterium]